MKQTAIASSVSGGASFGRALFWLFVGLFAGVSQSQTQNGFEIFQMPLVSDKSIDPNVVYIHDDSGSMLSSYMPAEANNSGGGSGYALGSPFWNTMYYNPDQHYPPPYRYDNGKLVRYPNSDTRTQWPTICRNGYVGAVTGCGSGTTDGPVTLRADARARFVTRFPTGGDLSSTATTSHVTAYWDYVPGYSSMRDNPDYDPKKRPEDDRHNYEYWAFRAMTAGDHFRRWGNDKISATDTAYQGRAFANRTIAQNNALVNNRACPTVFREQRDGKDYYAGNPVAVVGAFAKNPTTGKEQPEPVAVSNPIWQVTGATTREDQNRGGVAHAHCRRSYRVYEVYESGIMQGYSSTSWYTRSDAGTGNEPADAANDAGDNDREPPEAGIYRVLPQKCSPVVYKNPYSGEPDETCTTVDGETDCVDKDNTCGVAGASTACYNPDLLTEDDCAEVCYKKGNFAPRWKTCSNPPVDTEECEVWQNTDDTPTANTLTQPTNNVVVACTDTPENASVANGALPTTNNLVRARSWCVRSSSYANRSINYRQTWERPTLTPALTTNTPNNNAFTPWQSLTGGTTVPTTGGGTGTAVTCYAGRHAIGDSTGKGWWDPVVDGNVDKANGPDAKAKTTPVSHFEFAGNGPEFFVPHGTGTESCGASCTTTESTTARGQVRYVGKDGVVRTVATDGAQAKCPDGICSNLLGAEQSIKRLVSQYIDDKGELRDIPEGLRRRTVGEEIRNYMNWFTYYRTRNMLAKTGMSLAFAKVINPENTTEAHPAMNGKYIRLGFDTINSGSIRTTAHNLPDAPKHGGSSTRGPGQNGRSLNNGNYGAGIAPFRDFPAGLKIQDPAYPDDPSKTIDHPYQGQKFVERFYKWVNGLVITGSTPLHRAINSVGQYYMTEAPWKEYPPKEYGDRNPYTGENKVLSCRRSFLILMTDGYANDSRSQAPVNRLNSGNVDCASSSQWPKISQSDDKNSTNILKAESPFCGEYKTRGGSVYRVRNSLSDKAMFYWGINLLSQYPPKVTPTKKDPAFWPHMQTFTIGLGVQGRLSDAEVNSFLSDPASLIDHATGKRRVPLWTNPTGLDTDYEAVDDLMHAGLNGHGGAIAASDGTEFAGKLTALLTQLAGDVDSNTNLTGSGKRNEESTLYMADYNGLNWSGSLVRKRTGTCMLANGKDDITKILAEECKVGAAHSASQWDAATELVTRFTVGGGTNPGEVANRNVITWLNGQGARFARDTQGLAEALDVPVTTNQPHAEGNSRYRCPIPRVDNDCWVTSSRGNGKTNATLNTAPLIDYLRGDNEYEDKFTANFVVSTYNGFRSRKDENGKLHLLGDIINSDPYVQGNFEHNDAGWGGFRCGEGGRPVPDSTATLSECTQPGAAVAFFSADDVKRYRDRIGKKLLNGMEGITLEGLETQEEIEREWARGEAIRLQNTTVYVGANDGMLHAFDGRTGREHFAYVPAGVHKRLKFLADPLYDQNHKFYVDGSPFVEDVLLEGEWHSVLVGHTGRGGRSFFALDVERPESFSAANVLWEITGDDYGDLGYPVDGEAVITPVHGLKRNWGVIFGNGYNSDRHDACLFVVSLEWNPEVHTICVNEGSAQNPNGLSVPVFVDTNGDGTADFAYAGDAHGNFWKFNLMTDPMSVGNGGQPILRAISTTEGTSFANARPQPIIAPALPVVVAGSAGNYNTLQLVVGTGKLFEQKDLKSNTIQSIYGIRDYPSPTADEFQGTAEREINLLARTYVPGHPETDKFCRYKNAGVTVGCKDYKGWRLASLPNAETGDYRSDTGPKYGAGHMGYVIDFNAPRMKDWLVTAQGTIMKTKGGATTNIVVPPALTSDDPCYSGKQGGLVEINPESGGWTKSELFADVANRSNLFSYPGSYGKEINPFRKFSISSSEKYAFPDPKDSTKMAYVHINDRSQTRRGVELGKKPTGQNDCDKFGSGDNVRGGKETVYVSGTDEPFVDISGCGGRSGRQSWRQLR